MADLIALDLQRIHGPYGFPAGIEASGQHDVLQHGQQPMPAANGTRRRMGYTDGQAG